MQTPLNCCPDNLDYNRLTSSCMQRKTNNPDADLFHHWKNATLAEKSMQLVIIFFTWLVERIIVAIAHHRRKIHHTAVDDSWLNFFTWMHAACNSKDINGKCAKLLKRNRSAGQQVNQFVLWKKARANLDYEKLSCAKLTKWYANPQEDSEKGLAKLLSRDEHGLRLDRTAIFLKIDGSDWENFCIINVIILSCNYIKIFRHYSSF